ncbi:tRNA pseudouridine(55) synthase TruB [Liquorilactobacillus mali]|uniref:tRNA pseudouridine synthase B n=1 Tax=Liquorilactobacillus mali TaxID=1618 RepID=A0A0R2FS17_9LACO|nr:tRNA pseudouridine(55) synthase TruB [Liquorilactobacillus mali]KRN30427.1 tRNA pseudouridine synthase B [Liquorilactobacillus mali]MDN7144627.1 tRNA pseudouridine(55) synthase TruB [Liquorilactobacillus mali]
MDGIIPVYKERGMTSTDCVFKCRKIFKMRRVGHSGTLDPNVDGVLPICVGKATKVVNYLMDSGKVYIGEITLGFSTTTEDLDGEIVDKRLLDEPFTSEEINDKMDELTGDLIQIPPMYSAIKVKGRRLYDYARSGDPVERPERNVHIEYFKQTNKTVFDSKSGCQKIYFEVGCGKGTYIRTLAVDLGRKLGVPAVMSDLSRLSSGGFTIGQAVKISELEQAAENGNLEGRLYPVDYALQKYFHIELNEKQWEIIRNGGFLFPDEVDGTAEKIVLMYQNRARCIYRYNEEKKRYQPEQMIDLT